jgi:Lysophospholipase L1 and related esterases
MDLRVILICSLLMYTSCKQQDTPSVEISNIQETTATTISTADHDLPMEKEQKKVILFFGDSLTAGFGLEEEESFPSLIQQRIDSLGLDFHVINAGLSGETTAGGKGRISWVLNQQPHLFVLELGANDMLRGLDIKETNKNLRAILDEVKNQYPSTHLVIAGMQAPPNMGQEYTSTFARIFSQLALDYNADIIPFLLDGVAGIPSLNLSDGKHPNARGQKIVRDNVWDIIEPKLI